MGGEGWGYDDGSLDLDTGVVVAEVAERSGLIVAGDEKKRGGYPSSCSTTFGLNRESIFRRCSICRWSWHFGPYDSELIQRETAGLILVDLSHKQIKYVVIHGNTELTQNPVALLVVNITILIQIELIKQLFIV